MSKHLTRIELCESREEALKILTKYEKALAKLEKQRANKQCPQSK